MAAKIVAEIVRSTIGPRGMDKMLVAGMGDIVITNDGATIMKEMDVQNPAAKMIVEISKTQDSEVGDGTTTAVVLAGELLAGAETLLDKDVHPNAIIDGYRNAAGKAQEILEKIAPLVIRERYLRDSEYVRVVQMFDSMLKTPGERRAVGPEVLEAGIVQGIKQGLFGLGDLSNGNAPICRYFKEDATVSASDVEILIREDVCIAQRKSHLSPPGVSEAGPFPSGTGSVQLSTGQPHGGNVLAGGKNELGLRFRVPRGKVSQIMGIMNFLQSKFQSLDLEITARDGSLSEDEFANKIKEAFKQLGVTLEETS